MHVRTLHHPLLLGLAPLLLQSFGISQELVHLVTGNSNNAQAGRSVAAAGDVNGDGVDDFIVGWPLDGFNGSLSGSAVVYSGVDASVLLVFHGDAPGDRFGSAVGGAGDVDGDGFADLIVGAPFSDLVGSHSGRAKVFSGQGGALLYDIPGQSENDAFGTAVSGAGDPNGDGFADFIVGAPNEDVNSAGDGSARVYSGADGSLLHAILGSHGEELGISVSGAGDVDGDGFDDFIVGAWKENTPQSQAGTAQVYSGLSGNLLYSFAAHDPVQFLGVAVAGAGDLNGDGFDDLVVGANMDSFLTDRSGFVRAFSGASGALMYQIDGEPGDLLGSSVSGGGDVDGDGFDDFIVGAPGSDPNGPASGSARVYSGASGRLLYTFQGGSAGDLFGTSVSGGMDVNQDGFADLLIGAPKDRTAGPGWGAARVFSGGQFVGTSYCESTPNSTGSAAQIYTLGSARLALNDLELRATPVPVHIGLFYYGSTAVELPFGNGIRCVGGTVGRLPLTIALQNIMITRVNYGNPPTPQTQITVGSTWNFQAWFRDPFSGNVFAFNLSDARSITFLP